MYIGKRDKLISLRVSSRLLDEFQKVVDKHSRCYTGRGNRNYYVTNIPGLEHSSHSFQKFSAADLFEEALKAFIDNVDKAEGAK